MTLHQLRIFLSVCELRSFTRAAQELHLSQPSISVQLHQLEDILGCKLIEQIGKSIYLTEAGKLLEPYARKIFYLVEESQQVINDLKGLQRGAIHIGASTTPGTYLLPRILGEFKAQYPQIEVTLEIANSREIQERLLHNTLDLGFIGGGIIAEEIKSEPYLMDELVLIAGKKGLFKGKGKEWNLKELEGQRFILREKGSATREVIEKLLREQGFEMKISLELGSPEAVKQAVEAGLGLSFVSRYSVLREVAERRLTIVKLKNICFQRPLIIVYHRDKVLSRAVLAFLEIAKDMANKINNCFSD
jgi:DNA-binding transcriptional LysR family regulator